MNKVVTIGVGVIIAVLYAILFNFSPDAVSTLILVVMTLITLVGYIFGMLPISQYTIAFRTARSNIDRAVEIQADSTWLSVQQLDSLFEQRHLNRLYDEYVSRVEVQSREGHVVSDIEEVVNTESLAIRSWQNVLTQIPNTLTSLGLLGTFLGLIIGISTIGFSSVDAALTSIELLLEGIRTAFYTSIAGVIMSLFFGAVHRLMWNVMVRELNMFLEYFHLRVMPSVEEQERKLQYDYQNEVLDKLERIPKEKGFSLSNSAPGAADSANEQHIMKEIEEGLANGEFTFFVQPRCSLTTRKIVGGEALLRWNSKSMGMVSPATFLPVVERNGYIVKLDCYIWEEICKTIRRWIDDGNRPVPISINISKTDLMAIDVVEFFQNITRKYRIPPRSLVIELAQNAYTQHAASTHDVETRLRQAGFCVMIDGFDGDLVSMHFLKDMDADGLKLDMRYLKASGPMNQALSTMFEHARKMQLNILAEGIENAEQLTALRRAGCEEGQGFYLYKPMPVSEFKTILDSERE